MLKIPIKAGQITNLTDARYFAAKGVEWLSYKFNTKDKFSKQLQKIKAIKEWVEGPVMIAELDLTDTRDILEVINYLEFKAIQLTMSTSLEQVEDLKDFTLFKEIIYSSNNTLQNIFSQEKKFTKYINYFILNFKKAELSWEDLNEKQKAELKSICEKFPIILNIDIDPKNLEVLLNNTEVKGLELIGGEEEKIGIKSFDDLDELFEIFEN